MFGIEIPEAARQQARTEGTAAAFLMLRDAVTATEAMHLTKGRSVAVPATPGQTEQVRLLVQDSDTPQPVARVESIEIDGEHAAFVAYGTTMCYLVTDTVIATMDT